MRLGTNESNSKIETYLLWWFQFYSNNVNVRGFIFAKNRYFLHFFSKHWLSVRFRSLSGSNVRTKITAGPTVAQLEVFFSSDYL